MPKKQLSKLDSFQLFSSMLIIGYLCIGFIPNLEAVDKIAPQWVGMSLLNLVSLLTLIYHRKNLTFSITNSLISGMSITYIGFILWAGLSYFYAINSTEVLVNITRQFNVLLMFLSMSIILYKVRHKKIFFSWIITIILGIEIYAVLNEAIEMINSTGTISSGSLKGVTANRNITAFSIAIKIPFILFIVYKIKNSSYKIILGGLIFLSLFCLSIIQSRASFIAIGGIFIAYTGLNIYLYFKERNRLKLFQIGYFILPLILALLFNQMVVADKGADAVSRAATISISTNDGSVNQRLRYYSDVLTHLKSNPIFGTGLGNWKLKSIEYDSTDIVGYVVPYHAHSDFIQLGAELGIIGFFLYLGIFLWALYYTYSLLRFSDLILEEKVFLFLILTALGVYSIDANLNFPIARPQVLVVWSLIMAFIMTYYQKIKSKKTNKLKENKNLNLFFLTLAILSLLPSLYITNQVYKSLKGQMFLLQDFNSNQFSVPLNRIDNIVPDIPNITVTTIPINTVKARYYVNAKKYDKALNLIDKGTKANPYLYYSEILKSQIFEEQGKLDSAKIYAKKAFFGLPNNDLHASKYINLINKTRDRESLEQAFEWLTINNNPNNWKNYLIIASGLYPPGDKNLIKKAERAKSIFQGNQEFEILYRQILLGQYNINSAANYSNNGLQFFNNLDYENAAIEFEKAIKLNPLDYSYYENAATSNYMIGNLDKALEQIDKVISDYNPLNGKCEYIKALIFIKLGDPIGACPLIEISQKRRFYQSNSLFEQYCK